MFNLPAGSKNWVIDSPQIMGILNCTPDSFYQESRIQWVDQAIQKAGKMISEGASIIDIGGQSTRPGAGLVTDKEELERILPVIKSIRQQFPSILISVDTFHATIAKAALEEGANIINDISGGRFDKQMMETIVSYKAGYVGMHSTGTFETMHQIENRDNLVSSLITYFNKMKNDLAEIGLTNWVMDPGFGFGKTMDENLSIVNGIGQLKTVGLPILLGVSRKSTIYKTLGISPEASLNGTTILNTIGVLKGADILRVHDVKEAKEVVDLLKAIPS
jgi:dihydropteroate synthase